MTSVKLQMEGAYATRAALHCDYGSTGYQHRQLGRHCFSVTAGPRQECARFLCVLGKGEIRLPDDGGPHRSASEDGDGGGTSLDHSATYGLAVPSTIDSCLSGSCSIWRDSCDGCDRGTTRDGAEAATTPQYGSAIKDVGGGSRGGGGGNQTVRACVSGNQAADGKHDGSEPRRSWSASGNATRP